MWGANLRFVKNRNSRGRGSPGADFSQWISDDWLNQLAEHEVGQSQQLGQRVDVLTERRNGANSL